jgi:eukaryotic-like serine/threonine-protein kinase
VTVSPGPFGVGTRLGPYRIEELLGFGASAIVFRGVREPEDEVVALKVFRADLSDDPIFRRRFEHEVRSAQEVQHRHLVAVIDFGVEQGRLFLTMRYGGSSLGDRLKAEGALPIDEAIRIVAHTAAGLDALHRQRLVHRDVKPSNIMIDDDGVAAVADFGLAKGASYTELTTLGQVIGTIDYLAPELVKGEGATPASDIYALGCVTYECLTGRTPFANRSVLRVGAAHLEEGAPNPRELRPELPPALADTVLRALAKQPGERPSSAVAYAHMLDVARRSQRG